jgi:hypothetical protein
MSDVVFRRIGGRVIPIRLNKSEKKDLATGAALLGAGVGLAVGGGVAYRKAAATSLKYAEKAAKVIFSSKASKKMGQLSFDDLLHADKSKKQAYDFMKKARNLERATPLIRNASWLAGTGLTAIGGAKVAGSLSKTEHKNNVKALGAAAPAIVSTSFMLGVNPKATAKSLLSKVAKLRF